MTEPKPYSIADLIREARHSLAQELRSQAEQLEKLQREFTEVRQRHQRLEEHAEKQWAAIERAVTSALQGSPDAALEKVLSAVRSLITCTQPEQVLEVLGVEASRLGVRAAVFDVRGKAAWGASVSGFGPLLSEKAIRALIIPLNQENPFRQVCETGDYVDASAETLKKNRNVLEKLRPAAEAPILLLPVRSAGTVSAILYADPGAEGVALPVNTLKILSEFAGAQLDRMIALSGGLPAEKVEAEAEKPPETEAPVEEAPVEPPAAKAAEAAPEPVKVEEALVTQPSAPPVEVVQEAPAPMEVAEEAPAPGPVEPELPPPPVAIEKPPEVSVPAAPVETPAVEEVAVSAPPAAPAESGIAQLSEAEQKVHKDAKRFAKLLVTEIELYNKVKVADGRKNKDLYKRLKSDIDRSRQTYDKRFGKILPREFDYFHEELVSTLGANDSTVLGPGYPGPSA